MYVEQLGLEFVYLKVKKLNKLIKVNKTNKVKKLIKMTKTNKINKVNKIVKVIKATKTTLKKGKKGGEIEKSIFFENKSCSKKCYIVVVFINRTKSTHLFVCTSFVRKIKKM